MLHGGSARFERLLAQLSEEHDLELKILQETNRQLQEEIRSLKSLPQETARPALREVGLAVDPPDRPNLELEIEKLRDETAAAADSFAFSSPSPSQSLRIGGAETTAVELTVYSVQGLPDALIQKGGGGPSTISKCRISTNIGLQIKATEWTALNQEPGRPGECHDSSLWGAVWGPHGASMSCFAQVDDLPDKLELNLEINGYGHSVAIALVEVNADKQLWKLDNGGHVEAKVLVTRPRRRSMSGFSQASGEPAANTSRGSKTRRSSLQSCVAVDLPPMLTSRTENGSSLLTRLEKQFDIEDAGAKVIMPNDLLAAMKTSRKTQTTMPQLPTLLNTEELEEVIMELRRIHQTIFEKGPRTSLQGKAHQAFQPVISWKAFQECLLVEDLPSFASGRVALNLFAVQQALLGDAVPTTGATKALLTAYEDVQKPSKPTSRWVSVVSGMSTAAIILSFVLMGLSLDNWPDWAGWMVFEALFASIFVLEIVVKCVVLGPGSYFCGAERWWNWLDVGLTLAAVLDLFLNLIFQNSSRAKIILVLRGLRLARVARLAKLINMPLLQELANIVSGFLISVRSLFWVVVTLSVVVYVCALALRSLVQSFAHPDTTEKCGSGDDLDMSSDNVPLGCGRSLTMIFSNGFGLRFDILYAFSMVCVLFGLFNIITAIFVEATLNGLKETETQRKYAKAYETSYMTEQLAKLVVCVASQTQMMRSRKTIRGLNSDESSDEDEPGAQGGEIYLSEEEFNHVIRSPEVRQLLDSLDVVVEPRPGVFDAFNAEEDGAVSMSEIVSGLMRLRGDLNKVDIVITQMALENLHKKQVALMSQMSALQDGHARVWQVVEKASESVAVGTRLSEHIAKGVRRLSGELEIQESVTLK